MSKNNKYARPVVTALAASLLGLLVGCAQMSGSGSNASTSSSAKSATASATAGSKVSKADQELMEDIAHANIAEIQTGQLALEKSKNEQVRKFAQKMVDDHTMAMQELQKVAAAKGVTLPTDTDPQHKVVAAALKVLSGDTFDRQYMSQVGVADHKRTHELLEKTQRTATDTDLKAYAQKTISVVHQHLQTAQQITSSIK
jgi:putative membrane protein